MRALKLLPLGLSLLVLCLASAGSCTYAPEFDNGKLLCGAQRACPKGYSCMDDQTCWKTGSMAAGSGGSGTGGMSGSGGSGTGGMSGSGGSGTGGMSGSGGMTGIGTATRANLLGVWDFTAGTLTITCSDNTSQTKQLMGPKDYIELTEGPATAIVGSYYCDWILNLAIVGGRATTMVRPAQSCQTSSGGTDFTWNATTFAFTSSDGMVGKLNGTIQATYKDATGTGSCMLLVMGDLKKAL